MNADATAPLDVSQDLRRGRNYLASTTYTRISPQFLAFGVYIKFRSINKQSHNHSKWKMHYHQADKLHIQGNWLTTQKKGKMLHNQDVVDWANPGAHPICYTNVKHSLLMLPRTEVILYSLKCLPALLTQLISGAMANLRTPTNTRIQLTSS